MNEEINELILRYSAVMIADELEGKSPEYCDGFVAGIKFCSAVVRVKAEEMKLKGDFLNTVVTKGKLNQTRVL